MRALFLLCLLLPFASCALPVPLSEGVMFTEGSYGKTRPLPIDGSRQRTNIRPAAGVGTSMTFYPPGFGRTLAEQQGNEFGDRQNGLYQLSLPAPQLGIGLAERGAFAFTPGAGFVGLGANGTVRLFHQTYLTANALLLPTQWEIILQQRVLQAEGSGLSAGVFYRHELQDDGLFFEPDGPLGVSVVGARAAFRFDGGWLRMQGYTSLGYAPDFRVPVFGVGLMHTL